MPKTVETTFATLRTNDGALLSGTAYRFDVEYDVEQTQLSPAEVPADERTDGELLAIPQLRHGPIDNKLVY